MKVLITSGRTITQGEQLYYKDTPAYSKETSLCFIHPFDLLRLNAEDGDNLLIKTDTGSTVFKAVHFDGISQGMVFVPCGPHANTLLHARTHSTGAPDYKWMHADITKTDQNIRSGWDCLMDEGGILPPEASGEIWPDEGNEFSGDVFNVLCPLCGCLCDDLVIRRHNNEIISVDNACTLGSQKFLSKSRLSVPYRKKGKNWEPVEFDEAIFQAANILSDADRPLLFGWSGTSCEAQAIGIHIAEHIGGIIDNCSSICHGPSILAIQETGHPGSTLGQVKNRANVVIYWGSNPIESHPRHLSRYTTYANGRFTEEGHKNRTLIVVDIRETETAKIADEFIRIKPGGDYAVFGALRAILSGHSETLPARIAGVKREKLIWLVETCKTAKFGALFTGIGLTQSPGKYKNVRSAIELIDELNRYTKFVLTPMRGHWNVYGTNQSFSYLGGFPYGIDFSRGMAYYNPGETTAVDLLKNEEIDACLIIGADPGAHFPRKCNEHLARIPVVVIDPFVSMSTAFANLHIPVACVGIDTEGTGYRMDSVPLRMRQICPEKLPTDEEILNKILHTIKSGTVTTESQT